MSEEINQTQPVENSTPQWDFVLKQLEKVESLNKSIRLSNFRIRSLQKDVQVIKQVNQVDEKTQGQLDKKDNVINDDTKSLPSVLKQDERKRYENIGKQFVKGAGNEFEKIKKALKLKQQMDTKKQQFEKSTKKVEETVKSTNKKKGFWVKFLAIVGVLALVAAMFRDKIANLLPDLSSNTGNITQKIASFFFTMLQQMFTFTTGALGGIFSSTIKYACTNILPNLVNLFFTETLPMAMLASTLAVMSMFSSSAGEQLESLIGTSTRGYTEKTADAGEAQLIKQQNQQLTLQARYTDAYIKELEAANDTYMARTMVNTFAQAMMEKNQGAWQSATSALNELGYITREGQKVTMAELVKSGAIDITSLLRKIHQLNSDNTLSGQKKRLAFMEFIKGQLDANKVSYNETDIANIGQLFISEKSKGVTELAEAMVNDSLYQRLNKVAYEVKVPNTSSVEVTTVSQPTEMPLITNIQVGQIIQYALAEKIYNVLQSIDNFLNNKSNSDTIQNGVIQFFGKLKSSCIDYFLKPFKVFADGMERAFTSLAVFYEPPTDKGIKGNSPIPTKIYDSNVLLVQLNFDDTYTMTFGSALQSMLKNSNDAHIIMNQCNEQLKAINGKFVGFVHTRLAIRGASSEVIPTQSHVNATIDGLSKRVLNNESRLGSVEGEVKDILEKLGESRPETEQETANAVKQTQ